MIIGFGSWRTTALALANPWSVHARRRRRHIRREGVVKLVLQDIKIMVIAGQRDRRGKRGSKYAAGKLEKPRFYTSAGCVRIRAHRDQAGLRSDLKVARRSDTRSAGCSQAAK